MLAWSGFRRGGGGFSRATGKHRSEFGDLSVDLKFLLCKTSYGCFDNGVVQFWHVFSLTIMFAQLGQAVLSLEKRSTPLP